MGGTINLNAAEGIAIDGRISAGQDIVATTKENGITVYGNANIDADNDVKLTVDKGDITVNGTVVSNNGNIEMNVDTGNVNVTGDITKTLPALEAAAGEINIAVDKGNIKIGENTPENLTIFADGNISIKTTDGIITISGKTKSGSGDVNIRTGKSTTRVAAAYFGDGAPMLLAATDDDDNSGDVLINAELEADHSVYITTNDGDINITKKILVTNGDIIITTSDGKITIGDNGSKDMLSAQNDLDILTTNGAVVISGKVSTQDGNITITSNQDSYTAGQKGITVDSTGAINPGKNIDLNTVNGDIEFKKISAQNVDIKTVNGNVTGNTVSANELVHIELVNGDLYLNLAEGKGVVILADNATDSKVKTIRANSLTVDRNLVKVGRVISAGNGGNSGGGGGGGAPIYSNTSSTTRSPYSRYSDILSNAFGDNFVRNRSTTLGTTLTRNASTALTTYWQTATSATEADYSFSEFESDNDMSYRLTRNYFEVRFVPTWLDEEFLDIDFDYNFGIRNATEDELTID